MYTSRNLKFLIQSVEISELTLDRFDSTVIMTHIDWNSKITDQK